MKVIDILNKIANGEEVPNHIKISDDSYYFSSDDGDYYNDNENNPTLLERIWRHNALVWLNLEIEIIEEEQNIKELWIDDSGYIHTELGSWKGRKMDIAFATKINEVVKEVNKQKNNEEVL